MTNNIPADEAREFLQQTFGEAPPQPQPQPKECKDVCIALLAYDGRMEVRTSACITQSSMKLAQSGRGVTIIHRDGDSMVARGRSFLCSQFLENPGLQQCSDILMVDVDLTWDDPDIFTRICSYPEDIVGALYPFKQEEPSFPHRWPWYGINETKYGDKGQFRLWDMMGITPGFLKISRRALTAIAKQKPWLEFYDKGAAGKRCWMFFDNTQRNVGVFDEGYVFCEHAKSVGLTTYIDPDIVLTHIGKKAYKIGSFAQYLDGHSDHLAQIMHEFPHVPDAIVAQKVLGKDDSIDLAQEEAKYAADHQHRDAGTPRAAVGNGDQDPSQHQPAGHDVDDLGGRGRHGDEGRTEATAAGLAVAHIDPPARRQPRGKVRSRPNGKTSGHLPSDR